MFFLLVIVSPYLVVTLGDVLSRKEEGSHAPRAGDQVRGVVGVKATEGVAKVELWIEGEGGEEVRKVGLGRSGCGTYWGGRGGRRRPRPERRRR